MSSIAAGTTTTTGYVVTSDSTGALVLKTGASATTAVTIDTSQNVTFVGSQTLSAGTANGVLYLNGSKVATSGSALTFDGTRLTSTTGKFGGGAASNSASLMVNNVTNTATGIQLFQDGIESWIMGMPANSAGLAWSASGSEQMRLTSTGLGIGTSSPASKLHVATTTSETGVQLTNNNATVYLGAVYSANNFANGTVAGQAILRSGVGIAFSTTSGASVQATLDGSGNLGLGVTPSAWASNWRAIEFANGSSFAATVSGSNTVVLNNAFNDGSGFKYKSTAAAGYYAISTNQHVWYTAPSGTAGNAITFTQAMTLDASGNLGVGGSSPSTAGTGKIFALQASGSTASQIKLQNGNTGSTSQDGLLIGLDASTSAGYLYNYENAPLIFGTNDAERARIDSSGNLLVGTTSAGAKLTVQQSGSSDVIRVNIGTGGTGYAVIGSGTTMLPAYFATSGGVTFAGQISCSGSTTSYATSSDYRLKNITGNLTGYKERLMSLQPKQGTWIVDGSEFRGFLAHEFANPYSASVSGEKDAVDAEGKPIMQSMQASSSEVMADLVALVQEQQAIIQQLQADVAALKGTA